MSEQIPERDGAQSRLTAVDLFAGAGGLSVGLQKADFDVRAAVEIDPTSAATYRLNHKDTPVLVADIRRVTGAALLRAANVGRGELDLLTGCPPCQGFSALKTRRQATAVDDNRNDLLFEMLRLTRAIRPRALILENVPGLADDGRFAEFRQQLAKAGYRSDFAVLDAAAYGVPQRRRRLVLVAIRCGEVPAHWKDLPGVTKSVAQAFHGLGEAGASGDKLHDLPARRSALVEQRIAAIPHDGGSRSDLPAELQLACHARSNGYSDVYGRMAWNDPAPTITSGCHNPSKGRFLHPVLNRNITLREAALLQSFPKDYEFALTRGKEHVASQIGNAFPPDLIVPIARSVRQALGVRP
jgi:DNA (cytosine-5)-methyltransferase 1